MIFECSKGTICFVGGGSPWNCCFLKLKAHRAPRVFGDPHPFRSVQDGRSMDSCRFGATFCQVRPQRNKGKAVVMSDSAMAIGF